MAKKAKPAPRSKQAPPKDWPKSPQFRTVYTNAITLQFTDHEALLGFGLNVKNQKGEDDITEEVRVVLTPKTAKLLSHILTNTIAAIEKTTGSIIPTTEKIAEIDEMLKTQSEMLKTLSKKKPKIV